MIVDISTLEKYAFFDPASNKAKKSKRKSRQAGIVIAVDHLVRIFVLYSWAGNLPTSKFRDKIIDTYEKWEPRRMGLEANGTQVLFGDLVIDKAKEKLGKIKIIPIPSPTKVDKNYKIRTTLEPIINDGRLFIPENMIELRSELQSSPTGRFNDLIDCLAMACTLIPRRRRVEEKDLEIDQYAKYLRDTGAPMYYIEEQVAKMRREVELMSLGKEVENINY